MPSFYLVRLGDIGEDGRPVDIPLPEFGLFESGPEAAKAAKVATDQLNTKVQPRRMSQVGDWRGRLRSRFESGELTALPAEWTVPPIEDHFAHIDGLNHAGFICFFENEQHAAIGRVSFTTPGRYLQTYYPDLYASMSIHERNTLIATIDPNGSILFATTPEEMEMVYREGPTSCIAGKDWSAIACYPSRVYAAGDLALAYTKNANGRIQSRCLVWPDKKLYGRIYGDPARMAAALEAEGYSTPRAGHTAAENGKHIEGARIAKVFCDEQKHKAIMPYFDDIGWCIDAGDHWLTTSTDPRDLPEHPDYVQGSTVCQSAIYRWCPKLQKYDDVSRFVFVHGANEYWSDTACHFHAFRCAGSKEMWSLDHLVRHDNGRTYSSEWLVNNSATEAAAMAAASTSVMPGPINLYVSDGNGGWQDLRAV